MPFRLVACVFTTFAMTGLIWLVQIVHYPLFEKVGEEQFSAYQIAHSRRITPVVLPLMLAELLTSLWLVARPLPILRKHGLQPLMVTGLVLVLLIWLSTVFLQVPAHTVLEKGFDRDAWSFLVVSNWLRTLFWSARSVLLARVMLRLQCS